MHLAKSIALSLLVALLSGATAAGVTIFDNFKPGDVYDSGAGYNIQHYTPGIRWDYGVPITIGAEAIQLDQYVLPLKRRNAANWVRLEVRADDQGLPGETILEQIDIHDYPLDIPFVDDRPAPVVITSPTRPTIAAGAKIWIVMTAPEGLPFGDNSWGLVSIVNSNLVMAQRDTINTNYLWEAGVPIAYYPALRVTATPVPEPMTCLLLAAGGIGWASTRRLKRLRRIDTH